MSTTNTQWSVSINDPTSQLVFGIPILYLTLPWGIALEDSEYHSYFVGLLGLFAPQEKLSVSPSKAIMFGAGLFCSFVFFLSFYVYVLRFVSEIWNRYFVGQNDKYWLQGLVVVQLIDYGLIIYLPHYWYLSVAGAYLVYLFLLRTRFGLLRARLENKGIKFDETDINAFKAAVKRKFKDNPELIDQYILFRFCWRRYVYFGLFFGLPFLAVMAASHGVRRFTGDINFEWLMTGSYVASSMLFTMLFFFYFVLRLGVMGRTAERIDSNDYNYFLSIVR